MQFNVLSDAVHEHPSDSPLPLQLEYGLCAYNLRCITGAPLSPVEWDVWHALYVAVTRIIAERTAPPLRTRTDRAETHAAIVAWVREQLHPDGSLAFTDRRRGRHIRRKADAISAALNTYAAPLAPFVTPSHVRHAQGAIAPARQTA